MRYLFNNLSHLEYYNGYNNKSMVSGVLNCIHQLFTIEMIRYIDNILMLMYPK